MIKKTKISGFTLIELLIVMAVIGVLASVVTLNFTGSQKRVRDTARKSDLKQYQTALENYANRNNGLYPVRTTAVKPASDATFCTDLGLASGICPQDPRDTSSSCSGGGTCQYQYITDTDGQNYGLWARLEIPLSSSSPYFTVCSKGLTGETSSAPTSADSCGSLD